MSRFILKSYELGYPCHLDEAVVRIVDYDESGSWAPINNVNVFSYPIVASPHGTIIRTGAFHLSEITPEGYIKLLEYEKDAKESDSFKLYGNRLNEQQIALKPIL